MVLCEPIRVGFCGMSRPLRSLLLNIAEYSLGCFIQSIYRNCGPCSSIGIATGCTVRDQNSLWERDFPSVQTGPGAHTVSCTMGTGSFPGVKFGRGVLLITHPLLVPRSWKSRAIPLPTLWAIPGL